MIVKDWWYAIKVCRKYGITWNPFCELGNGHYTWSSHVSVNPFDRDFITIFMHEIGHHVHHKRVDMALFLIPEENELRWLGKTYLAGRSIYKVLDSEALASRFAVRSGKGDKEYLLIAFNTYSSMVFKNLPNRFLTNEFSNIVDCVYKNIRRIQK